MTRSSPETETLEPCPFCGNPSVYLCEREGQRPEDSEWRVMCDHCDATHNEPKDDAIKAWNTRAGHAQRPAERPTIPNILIDSRGNNIYTPDELGLSPRLGLEPAGKQARGKSGNGAWFGVIDSHNDPEHYDYRTVYALSDTSTDRAVCSRCEGKGYITKPHTDGGWYTADCPTCTDSSPDREGK